MSDRCAVLDLRIRFLLTNLKLGEHWIACRNVYKIEDYIGLVIQKIWKKVLGLVKVEPSRLVIVSKEDGPGENGMS